MPTEFKERMRDENRSNMRKLRWSLMATLKGSDAPNEMRVRDDDMTLPALSTPALLRCERTLAHTHARSLTGAGLGGPNDVSGPVWFFLSEIYRVFQH